MTEARLSLVVDGLEIPAVFTAPPSARAALLLVPGSLNSDVDGNYAPMFPGQPETRTNVYRDLAAQLAERGVAVLRFAKSGPGTGCVVLDEALRRERYRTFPQRVSVANAFLDELAQRAAGLPLAIAGHSEGAAVATLLAQRRPDVRRLVLLAGPSKPLLQLMIWQMYERDRAAGRATAAHDAHYARGLAIAHDYAAGRDFGEVPADNPYTAMVPFFLRPDAEPYLRSVEQVDPAAELAKVAQPVLLVQGTHDLSVDPPNAEALRTAQPAARVAYFPELQHCFKRVPAGLDPQRSWMAEGEVDPAVAGAVAGFIAPATANASA